MNKRFFRISIAAITAVSVIALCGSVIAFGGMGGEKSGDKGEKEIESLSDKIDPTAPVVVVNGNPLTRKEYQRELQRVMANLSQRTGGKHSAKFEPNNQIKDDALNKLVDRELIYREAAKTDFPELDNRIEEEIEKVSKQFPSKEEFEKALSSQDFDEKSYRDTMRMSLVIDNYVRKEILPTIEISDEKGKKFYEENPALFTKEEQVRASHILVESKPDASEEEKAAAKAKAEKILKEIEGGADFAEMAKEHSTCPSGPKGGDLGFFGKGRMVPPFEEAAFALKEGEVSDVVETQFGYHIIKCVEHPAGETVPYDKVEERIKEFLRNQEVAVFLDEKAKTLRESAKIEVVAPHL